MSAAIPEVVSRPASSAAGGRHERWDALGLTVAGLAAVWVMASALVNGANPAPHLAALAATVVAVWAGRRLGSLSKLGAPALVALIAATATVLEPFATFGSQATAGLLGYANAKAAYFVLAASAALVLAGYSEGWKKGATLAAAAAFAAVPIASRSVGATLVSVLLLPAAAAAIWGRPRRSLIAVCGAVLVIVAVGSVMAGLAFRSGGARTVAEVVGEERAALWAESADMMAGSPGFGVGPGRLDEESHTASSDRDLRWTHNEFLQIGAEGGGPAMLLLLLGFAWALGALWQRGTPAATITAAGVTALGVHAASDYLLHFPLLPIAAGLLVGSATAAAGAEDAGFARRAVKLAALPFGAFARRRAGDVTILLYHRAGPEKSEIVVPRVALESQLAYLAGRDDVVSLDRALEGGGGLVVTFDDGYRDFHEVVAPLLQAHLIPAHLYLATGLVDQSDSPIPTLTWRQLEEIVSTGLVTIGSHTHSHADLSEATEAQAEEEMRRSKELIEDKLGVACRHFAYPWAVGSPAADRVARRLFDSAALDAWRPNRRKAADPYRLGRTPILRSDGMFFFRAKVEGRLDAEGWAYRLARRGPWRPR